MDQAITEAGLRRDLAACYRLFDWMGWTELIFNHITLRLAGSAGKDSRYLINPFGLHYSEVTPDNLLDIDLEGNLRQESRYGVNRAGFIIHSAIHGAREDAHCIMHVHTTAGCAVSCKESGLRHDNFYSAMLYGDVAYHDYEGVTTKLDEQPRLEVGTLDRADRVGGVHAQLSRRDRVGDRTRHPADPDEHAGVPRGDPGDVRDQPLRRARTQPLRQPLVSELATGAVRDLRRDRRELRLHTTQLRGARALQLEQSLIARRGEVHAMIFPGQRQNR